PHHPTASGPEPAPIPRRPSRASAPTSAPAPPSGSAPTHAPFMPPPYSAQNHAAVSTSSRQNCHSTAARPASASTCPASQTHTAPRSALPISSISAPSPLNTEDLIDLRRQPPPLHRLPLQVPPQVIPHIPQQLQRLRQRRPL